MHLFINKKKLLSENKSIDDAQKYYNAKLIFFLFL